MTVYEATEYCRLRAAGAGLFERQAQTALQWYKAWEELERAVQAGYGQWPLAAVIQPTKAIEGRVQ